MKMAIKNIIKSFVPEKLLSTARKIRDVGKGITGDPNTKPFYARNESDADTIRHTNIFGKMVEVDHLIYGKK